MDPHRELARIRVQTARMMEIYALLQRELAEQPEASFRPQDIQRLHQAVATVEANMRELQEHLVRTPAGSSPASAEARELDQIVDAVLAWVQSTDA